MEKEAEKIVGLDVEYTKPERGVPQKAAVTQLCLGRTCLVYQISTADKPCERLADFLGNLDISFASVDIGNDIVRLEQCKLMVANFVDIQMRWKPPNSQNEKNSLADYIVAIIDIRYKSTMKRLSGDEHDQWEMVALSMKHIEYAAMDAYTTYEVYRCLVSWVKGQLQLQEFLEEKRVRKGGKNRKNKGKKKEYS